jgi:excisionase family DNA binding protein
MMPGSVREPTSNLADLASTPTQFAKRTGVSRATIYRALKRGQLKTVRISPRVQLIMHDQTLNPKQKA